MPVLLWNITPADEKTLDRYEEFPSYYRKERVLVGHKRQLLIGMAYVMNGEAMGRPSEAYFMTIMQGYHTAAIDAAPLMDALRLAQNSQRRAKA